MAVGYPAYCHFHSHPPQPPWHQWTVLKANWSLLERCAFPWATDGVYTHVMKRPLVVPSRHRDAVNSRDWSLGGYQHRERYGSRTLLISLRSRHQDLSRPRGGQLQTDDLYWPTGPWALSIIKRKKAIFDWMSIVKEEWWIISCTGKGNICLIRPAWWCIKHQGTGSSLVKARTCYQTSAKSSL